jgi:hypothetical protein
MCGSQVGIQFNVWFSGWDSVKCVIPALIYVGRRIRPEHVTFKGNEGSTVKYCSCAVGIHVQYLIQSKP